MNQKKWLWIIIAVVCLFVLIGTLWAVFGGVSSSLPSEPKAPVIEETEEPQDQQQENFPMVDESGMPIEGDDNFVEDPWADVMGDASEEEAPQDEASEIPQEEVLTDEDLAVTDEGWSGIY